MMSCSVTGTDLTTFLIPSGLVVLQAMIRDGFSDRAPVTILIRQVLRL